MPNFKKHCRDRFSYVWTNSFSPTLLPKTKQGEEIIMPYDPNYPYGFNPYNNYLRQQAPVQNNTYAFVNGIEGAKSYIVQPNQTVLLMDNDSPVCYMKQANGLGQSSLRYFKLVEVKESDLKVTNDTPNQFDPELFAKKEDFVTLKKQLDKLEKLFKDNKSKEAE